MPPNSDGQSSGFATRLVRWLSENVCDVPALAAAAVISAVPTVWLITEAIEHAAMLRRYGDAKMVQAKVEAVHRIAVSPARWQATLTWKDEAGRSHRAPLETEGYEFDAAKKGARIVAVEPAGGRPPAWNATAIWQVGEGKTQRAEVLVLQAENASRGQAPGLVAGDSQNIIVNRRNPADIAFSWKHPGALPLTLFGPEVDLILCSILAGMTLFAGLMDQRDRGKTPEPRPEFDAMGPEALARRNRLILILFWLILAITTIFGFLIVIITVKLEWVPLPLSVSLPLILGVGILATLMVPFMMTLPFGMKRLREFGYYVELYLARKITWRWCMPVPLGGIAGSAFLLYAWQQYSSTT